MKLQTSVACLILSAAVVAATGCTGFMNPSPVVKSLNLDGQWAGTTSQGKPITFTVRGALVTDFTVAYRLEQPGCEQDAIDSNSSIHPQFDSSKDWGQLYQYSSGTAPMAGKITFDFNTATHSTASGTAAWTANPSGASCSGVTTVTWNATKQ